MLAVRHVGSAVVPREKDAETQIGEDMFKSMKKGEEVTFNVIVDSKGQPQVTKTFCSQCCT